MTCPDGTKEFAARLKSDSMRCHCPAVQIRTHPHVTCLQFGGKSSQQPATCLLLHLQTCDIEHLSDPFICGGCISIFALVRREDSIS